MASHLELLPPEVYADILDHLISRDLLQLRHTSQSLFDLSEDYAASKRRSSRCAIEPTHAACCTLVRLEKFRDFDFLRSQRAPTTSEDLLHAEKSSISYLGLIIPGLLMPFVVKRETRRELDRTDLQTLRIAYIQYRDVWKATGQRYIEYQEGGIGILRGTKVNEGFSQLKHVNGVLNKPIDLVGCVPDYYNAQTISLRFNPDLNSHGTLVLLHSETEHNTDENMLSHVMWLESGSQKLYSIMTVVHVPEPGSIIREAYFWNNKLFLFCENYFLEAEIVGAKGTRLVVENQAGTYHTDIAASQDHAVSPNDTQVRYICEGKVLLGDYRVLDLDKQTVSHREPWVLRDKQGQYVDMPLRFGQGRFAVG